MRSQSVAVLLSLKQAVSSAATSIETGCILSCASSNAWRRATTAASTACPALLTDVEAFTNQHSTLQQPQQLPSNHSNKRTRRRFSAHNAEYSNIVSFRSYRNSAHLQTANSNNTELSSTSAQQHTCSLTNQQHGVSQYVGQPHRTYNMGQGQHTESALHDTRLENSPSNVDTSSSIQQGFTSHEPTSEAGTRKPTAEKAGGPHADTAAVQRLTDSLFNDILAARLSQPTSPINRHSVAHGPPQYSSNQPSTSHQQESDKQEAQSAAAGTSTIDKEQDDVSERRHIPKTNRGGYTLNAIPSSITTDPTHPYYPAPDEAFARAHVHQTVQRMMARNPRTNLHPDPGSLACLQHLRREQLWEVCVECGITPHTSVTNRELQLAVAGLVALARGQQKVPVSLESEQPLSLEKHDNGNAMEHTIEDAKPADTGTLVAAACKAAEDAALRALSSRPADMQKRTSLLADAMFDRTEQTINGSSSNGSSAMVNKYNKDAMVAAMHAMLQALVSAQQVACWLYAARAQEVILLDKKLAQAPGVDTAAPDVECIQHTSPLGLQLMVATGVSARHSAACAAAVRWQVQQLVSAVRDAAEPGSWAGRAAAQWQAAKPSGAEALSDWVALDARPGLSVNILTAPARAYYQLESKYMHTGQTLTHALDRQKSLNVGVRPTMTTLVTEFRSDIQPLLTLETITAADQKAAESQGSNSFNPFVFGRHPTSPTWDQILSVGKQVAEKQQEAAAQQKHRQGQSSKWRSIAMAVKDHIEKDAAELPMHENEDGNAQAPVHQKEEATEPQVGDSMARIGLSHRDDVMPFKDRKQLVAQASGRRARKPIERKHARGREAKVDELPSLESVGKRVTSRVADRPDSSEKGRSHRQPLFTS